MRWWSLPGIRRTGGWCRRRLKATIEENCRETVLTLFEVSSLMKSTHQGVVLAIPDDGRD
jgi:hypothetical protein